MNWDTYFMNIAKTVAEKSKDPSTKVGACIADEHNRIVSVGYNGFPRGVKDSPRFYDNRETKYLRVIHAEVNAILFAQRHLAGCKLYVTKGFEGFLCAPCTALTIQCGIRHIITPVHENHELTKRWKHHIAEAKLMVDEARVRIKRI